jgi:predicted aldo/keto reductase-like oxidoreductase
MMDAYNMRILNDQKPEHIVNRLKYHWTLDSVEAEKCTQCGICESKCTQHLPIMERLEEILSAGREIAEKTE